MQELLMNKWYPQLGDFQWKECANGKTTEINDIRIVIPNAEYNPVPMFCGICDFPMRTSDDLQSFRKFDCCENCMLEWAEARQEEWKNGWRPHEDVIEKYRQERILKEQLRRI